MDPISLITAILDRFWTLYFRQKPSSESLNRYPTPIKAVEQGHGFTNM